MEGTKVGNYRITAVIGEGGMGTVYRAVHEVLGRPVAVKLLLPEISSSRDMVTRFFNEARAVAAIKHPGIVEAYDFGFLPDDRAYIIMELLEGESLASRLGRATRMPRLQVLHIARSVARALHAAHEAGIVHRDIKPDNIFLVPDPEVVTGERVKLLDFGIAKLGTDGTERGLTRTGAVMGTPTYMSPEQCRGAGVVDRRADIYALGCILYQMLCGRPPFVAEGAGEIIARHLYFQPEPPRSLDSGIAPPLEALVMTLLQKDPAHRPPTALAVVEAIDHVDATVGRDSMRLAAIQPSLAGPPVHTTLGSSTASVSPSTGPPGRRRIKLVAGTVVAAAVVGAIAIVLAGGDRNVGGGPAAARAVDAAAESPPEARIAAADVAPPTADASEQPPPSDASEPSEPPTAPDEAAPAPPVATETKPPPKPTTPSVRSRGTPSPKSSSPASEVNSTCAKSSFSSVINAQQPDEATVQAALARLKKCQQVLAPDVYAELQQRLISKL
ncbi:MAG TPA: serine/threonine-protein kinase [Kofleriaceae bacterium]|nr:serine/threonine-protein kinase [Kofleriaceae bacterium]